MTSVTSSRLAERFSGLFRSQTHMGIAITVIALLAWVIWQYWGRAQLVAIMLGAGAGAALLFVYPVIGVMVSSFVMVSNLSEFVPGSLTPLMMLTIGIVIVKKLLAGESTWTITPFAKWSLIFTAWFIFSAIWAGSYRYLDWGNFLRPVLILLLFSQVIKTPREYIAVLLAAGAGTILTGVLTIQSAAEFYLSGAAGELAGKVGYIEQSRFFGIWAEPNLMALTQIPVIGFSIALLRTRVSRWIRVFAVMAAGAGLVTVMLSLSRGAALCTILMLLAIAVVDRYRLRILLVLGLLVTVVISVLPVDIIGRLATLATPKADKSISQRSELLFGGMRMIEDSFPMGVGAGNYRLHSMNYTLTLSSGMISHNSYIEVFAETGIIGILLFAGVLLSLSSTIRWRGRKLQSHDLPGNLNACAVAVMLGMLLAMAFLSATWYAPFWIFFAMISTLPLVFAGEQNQALPRRA